MPYVAKNSNNLFNKSQLNLNKMIKITLKTIAICSVLFLLSSCCKETSPNIANKLKSSFTELENTDINIIHGMYYDNEGIIQFSQNNVIFKGENTSGNVACNNVILKVNAPIYEDVRESYDNYLSSIGSNLIYNFNNFNGFSDFSTSLYSPKPFIPNIARQSGDIHVTWSPDEAIDNNILIVHVRKLSDPDKTDNEMRVITLNLDSKSGGAIIKKSDLPYFNFGDDLILDFFWGSYDIATVNGKTISKVSYFRNSEEVKL